MASGKTRRFEESTIRDGAERTYLSTKTAYRDARGRVAGIVGVSTDITERKRAEADAAFLLDLGGSIQMVRADDPTAVAEAALQRIVARFGADRAMLCELESTAPAEVDPPRPGRTARVRCEIVEAIPAGVRVGEPFGATVVAEGAGSRPSRRGAAHGAAPRRLALVGKGAEALLRGEPLVVGDVAADERTAPYHRSFARGGVAAFAAVPLRRHGRWVATLAVLSSVPRSWDARDVLLVRGAVERLWPAYDAARALAEARAARVEAEHARRAAEAANKAKSDFLAVMSHELRTPLNAIAGYAELLEMGVHGPVTDAQRTTLARVQRAQRHLLSLIEDVLDYARIETGRVEYVLRDVDLHEVLADVGAMIEPQLRSKELAYEVALPADLPRVRVDPEKLQQVVLNLLANAVKFTTPGGRVVIDAAQRPDAGQVIFLRVRDTGRGIPRQKLETIFEPFVQVDSSLRRDASGAGLGLAISRDLARGMGGDVRARSVEGGGSTFTITLPRA
jgi:signal transduction histidine kinase